MTGTISLYLHLGSHKTQKVRCFCCGLDDSVRMVDYSMFCCLSRRCVCCRHDQLLGGHFRCRGMANLSHISRYCLHHRQVHCIPHPRISNWLKDNEATPLFVAPKSVPKITQATLLLSVTGFIVLFCMILGLEKQTQPASFIIRSGLGTSGWSDGTAWMMGIGNAL